MVKSATALLADFAPVSGEQWLQQIHRDLKDRSSEDFIWSIPGGISADPFAHGYKSGEMPLPLSANAPEWQIAEKIAVAGVETTHAQVLAALEGGAEVLCLDVDADMDADAFLGYTEGVHADYIGWHFSGKGVERQPGAVFSCLEILCKERGLSASGLEGALYWNPVRADKPDWRYVADLIEYAETCFPHFRIISLSADFHAGDPVLGLQQILSDAHTLLRELTRKGVSPERVLQRVQLETPVGKQYFVEIAKLRALHILWANWLKSQALPPQWPFIRAVFAPEAYDESLYTNMIRATTMAMSAVLGGARCLTVLPFNAVAVAQAEPHALAFGRRIARNVQHLLKMESHLNTLADPAAGSYYIEQLTRQIAEKVWEGLPSTLFGDLKEQGNT